MEVVMWHVAATVIVVSLGALVLVAKWQFPWM